MGGIRVLDEALYRKPGLKVVMISAYGNAEIEGKGAWRLRVSGQAVQCQKAYKGCHKGFE